MAFTVPTGDALKLLDEIAALHGSLYTRYTLPAGAFES
jgi:hypothetical protein